MPLDLSSDCTFTGPALPEPFVKFNLEAELNRLSLLPKAAGEKAQALNEHWKFVRRKLGALVSHGGGLRVQNHVIEPLLAQLGYARIETVEAIQTREGAENGGALLLTEDGAARLRVWCVDLDADLDAPARRGLAYRFSHTRIAQRVLLATGERLGILTNGLELRLIISDPARVDSQVAISIDPHWKRSRDLPDSVRLLIALASPSGVKALPELIDKARLQQAKVTKDLREQARHAIREFIQELLDHPDNKPILAEFAGQPAENQSAANASPSPPSEGGEGRGEVGRPLTSDLRPLTSDLARALWHEGLITVYRLLFILKLESTDDPARSFSFASTSLWRNTFSPSVALAPIVRRVLDHGAQTGRLLQDGLRALFRMLSDGLQCTELNVRPMAGALFAPATTPILGRLQWTETAIAKLLDNLLWTRSGRGATARERVHYGPLDVEDLGRVYEALLELEPGISAEPMCRLRRAKLEVVVPAAQGERYRPPSASLAPTGGEGQGEGADDTNEAEEENAASAAGTKKTKVEWIEEIPPGRFYLRVGLGRKATGSFYTPHSFVRFLVRETLGPLVARCVRPVGSAGVPPASSEASRLRFGVPPSGGSESEVPTALDSPHAQPAEAAEAGTPNASPSPPSEGGEGRGEVGDPVSSIQHPASDPDPSAILKLKVIDKAMGSGHFLVESCRFLGEALYEACRRCDELAAAAEKLAESFHASAKTKPEHQALAAEQTARAAALRQRVLDLPDPHDELLRYLPSRSVEGTAGGVSHNKAIALCRRMVAVHCLYGVDKNPLAVELAKLALWIECHAEGLPLTFLDHRLVVGDSLTGPFFDHLLKYPGSQQPLDDLFTQGLTVKLTAALADALQHVRALEATVGVTVADIEAKQAAKTRLDRALAPFKILAAAWSGGVMLGPEGCDDTAYAALAKQITESGELPASSPSPPSEGGEGRGEVGLPQSEKLCRMIAKGLGLPADSNLDTLKSQISDPKSAAIPALSFDLAFPEVFYPDGDAANLAGFDADLGNPPWEGIDTSDKEFFAAFDFSILELKDDREIKAIIAKLLGVPEIKVLREGYDASIEQLKNAIHRNFEHINQAGNRVSAATPDLYQCFMERTIQVLSANGRVGVVLPSSVHANESSAGLRRLLLERMNLACCFSFENLRKLFEIDSRVKFAAIVAGKPGPTLEFPCAFYLHDDEWLFQPDKGNRLLRYTPDFLRQTTGALLNFLELRAADTVPIAHTMYRAQNGTFGSLRAEWHIFPTEELHTSKQRHRTRPLAEFAADVNGDARLPESLTSLNARGILPVCKGEHFHQFDSGWNDGPEVATSVEQMQGKEQRVAASRFYRMVFRQQASSTNERTVISFFSPPGLLYFHSALPERDAEDRANWRALVLIALANSYPFDWIVRQLVAANVTFNFLDTVPVPRLDNVRLFIAHQALRLSAQHAGYAPLWREQLGEAWREAGAAFTWPALSGEDPSAVAGTAKADSRWDVRAAIDAVVAQAYGLSRDQYAHVLSTFSHSSYKDAPRQCLAAFDELQSLGLDAFTKKHDPYWDIPLNENLPQPVIDLSIPAAAAGEEPRHRTGELFDFQTTAAPSGGDARFDAQPVTKPKW